MKLFFPLLLASAFLFGCSNKEIQIIHVDKPIPLHSASVLDSRVGEQNVAENHAGGQIIIPAGEQNVLTLSPYPSVHYPTQPKPVARIKPFVGATPNTPTNTEAPHHSQCRRCTVQEVWYDYCHGKVITIEQKKVLENNDEPTDMAKNPHDSCDPAWQGEK